MAKTLYLTFGDATTHRGNNDAKLNGTASFWLPLALSESHGTDTTGTQTGTATTVAGPTSGIEPIVIAGVPSEWLSDPLSADFTISGTITLNLWASESSNSANASVNAVIEKMDGATGALTQIAKTARTTELGTSAAAANFTVTPTSTACKRGDRLRVRVFADDAAANMGATFTFTFWFDRSTAAQGESFVTFTETLTFETAAPTGSTYYLTDTVSSINPGSATEKVASTSRGSGSVNSVTNTATGPTAGIQITNSGGGTALEWYTPPLETVTLGGRAKFNIRVSESDTAANASIKAEIAITAADGTGAAVWGIANIVAVGGPGEVSAVGDAASIAWVAGDDTSVTAGQRLRFRLFVDDMATAALGTGWTVTTSYNGTSAAAAGDTYVTLPVTVTEQTITTSIPDVGMALTVT